MKSDEKTRKLFINREVTIPKLKVLLETYTSKTDFEVKDKAG
ncbi:MAG TPA: hypothetical protein PKV93_05795 [Fervidobacterium sp.]|nr:hypothetical protein [Fervidobacterium sp.]